MKQKTQDQIRKELSVARLRPEHVDPDQVLQDICSAYTDWKNAPESWADIYLDHLERLISDEIERKKLNALYRATTMRLPKGAAE